MTIATPPPGEPPRMFAVGMVYGANGYAWHEDRSIHRVPAPEVDVVA